MSQDLNPITTLKQLQKEVKDMIKCVNTDFNDGVCEIVNTYGERDAYKKACYTIEGMLNELIEQTEGKIKERNKHDKDVKDVMKIFENIQLVIPEREKI